MERGGGEGWGVDILRRTCPLLFALFYINLRLPYFSPHQSNWATIAKFSRRVHIQGAATRTSRRAIKKWAKNNQQPKGLDTRTRGIFSPSSAYRSARSRGNRQIFLYFFNPIFVTVSFFFCSYDSNFPGAYILADFDLHRSFSQRSQPTCSFITWKKEVAAW